MDSLCLRSGSWIVDATLVGALRADGTAKLRSKRGRRGPLSQPAARR